MAFFNEENLKKQIKSGEFSRVYLIYGSEGYLKQFYANELCKKCVDPDFADFNLKKLDGKYTDLNEIYDCTTSFPMMGGLTCTLVKDFPLNTFVSDKGKLDPEFETVVRDIPETSVLIFWIDTLEVDEKKAKWSKIIKLIGEVGVSAKLEKRTAKDLEKLLISSASKKGCTLSKYCAEYMVKLVGDDMSTLQNELSKVCAYAGPVEITREHIDECVIVSIESRIFQLSRMIINDDADKAFEILGDLFKLREEPVVILSVLSKAFVDMYRIKAAMEKGVKNSEVADIFPGNVYKTRSFLLENAARDCRKYSIAQLKEALLLLSDADKKLKSTKNNPQSLLEELILRLLRL